MEFYEMIWCAVEPTGAIWAQMKTEKRVREREIYTF
jgi:hypothetical protein